MEPVEGELFSRNYIERGPALADNPRMRRRLYALYRSLKSPSDPDLGGALELRTGAVVPFLGMYGRDWEAFFETGSLQDILDCVTVFAGAYQGYTRQRWIAGVQTIFEEANVRYRIDRLGGVHFAVDGEYERNAASVVQGLGGSRYAVVREHIEAGQAALAGAEPQTREAIRQHYEAAEALFKLLTANSVSRLGVAEIQKVLQPMLNSSVSGTALDATRAMAGAFANWVVSAQGYRHAQATPSTDNPPVSFAVLFISCGLAFIRWLAELDAQKNRA